MRNLLVGSAIAFIALNGAAIQATASPNTGFPIQVNQDYNDFSLTQFGHGNRLDELEYEIFYQDTRNSWEGDNFSNKQTSYVKTKKGNKNWKLDLLCATNPQIPLEECDFVAQREVKNLNKIELPIFIMKELYSNHFPNVLMFIIFLLMPFFFKINVMYLVK